MRRIFEYFRNAIALRETQRQLYSLSDHMLRDIGLNRAMLLSVAVHGRRALPNAVPSTSPTP